MESAADQITEKKYPITTLWVFKVPIIFVAISIIAFFFGVWFPYFVILIPYFLIANPLIRKNFHFSVGEKYFVVDQGVFSKKHLNMPYSVMQNVIVKQDWFDRMSGLAGLSVENAVQDPKAAVRNQKQGDFLGASRSKVNLPGLKKADAEALKLIILERMKENEGVDTGSGL